MSDREGRKKLNMKANSEKWCKPWLLHSPSKQQSHRNVKGRDNCKEVTRLIGKMSVNKLNTHAQNISDCRQQGSHDIWVVGSRSRENFGKWKSTYILFSRALRHIFGGRLAYSTTCTKILLITRNTIFTSYVVNAQSLQSSQHSYIYGSNPSLLILFWLCLQQNESSVASSPPLVSTHATITDNSRQTCTVKDFEAAKKLNRFVSFSVSSTNLK